MSVENPSLLYVEQTLTAEQKARACLNIGAQPTVAGKGLSSNDYTDAEKLKLSGIDADAEENTIESITVNGSAVQPDITKNVAITVANVPTVTSNDDGKVLKASYSGGVGSYDWNTAGGGGEVNVIEAITVNSESTTISNKTVNIPAATASTSGAGGNSGVMTAADKEKLDGLVSNVQSDWNAASGSAAEILNKPTIPTVDQTYDGTSTNAQSGVAVASALSELSFDEVPPVTSSDGGKVLKASYGEGTGSYAWDDAPGLFEAVYGTTTYSEIAAAVAAHKIVYCKALVNNAKPSPQYRMAFLAYIIPSGYEFQYYRSRGTHTDSEQGDQMIIYKVSNTDTWSNETRKVYTTVVAGTNMSSSYDNNTLTLSATMPTVDQTYDSTSTNAQSGTAVASALSGIADVPTVGSNDNGKVLKASYSGGAGSYSWQPESGGGGGSTYTAGDGIDISVQDEISAKVDGTSITVNANHELTTSAEVNVIEGVKLDGAASVLTPDASKNVTIPNAVATGETGATNGLMSADDKKALGTAVQYVENPYEQSTPKTLIPQQMFVVESDQQIIDIVSNHSSLINGKGTLFFRITGV